MKKVKTINFELFLTFVATFVIGAVAVSLLSHSLISDDLLMVWPMYLGIVLFGLFGIAGFIGMIVFLRKHLILKNVLKYGTETVGEFVSVGKLVKWDRHRAYGPSPYGRSIKWYTQIIFKYTVDNEERTYTSCAVYLVEDAEKLEQLKTFPVKYRGKHAIICATV